MNRRSPQPATSPVRIQNRRLRECAKQGFRARLQAELAGKVPDAAPLHSHHPTRQSSFERGWQAVSARHIARARAQARQQEATPWIR